MAVTTNLTVPDLEEAKGFLCCNDAATTEMDLGWVARLTDP